MLLMIMPHLWRPHRASLDDIPKQVLRMDAAPACRRPVLSKCINRFVSVRLFPYLLVWLDWLSELFLIQQ